MRGGKVSGKPSAVCVYVECKGGVVEGEELDPNPMSFYLFFIMCSLFLGTRSFVQR